MVVLIIYTGFFLPFKLTFYDIDTEPYAVQLIDTIVDYLFMVDIVMNFITAYDDYDR